MKYRKKPVVIEAVQWLGDPAVLHEVGASLTTVGGAHGSVFSIHPDNEDALEIHTLEGNHRCDYGDWIIKGIQGEFYPCKPEIFEATYEEVPE